MNLTLPALLGLVLLAAGQGYAADEAASPPGFGRRIADGFRDAVDYSKRIAMEGDNVVYVSGYAYHDRHTYSPEKIEEFNEAAFGGGYGRTLINEDGNSDSLFALAFLDSHSDVQFQAGYAREWRWQFAEHAALGGGFVAMLVSRSDMFGGIPFPAILPLASIEVGPVAVMASYIPRLGGEGGNGNVLYLFGRINFGR